MKILEEMVENGWIPQDGEVEEDQQGNVLYVEKYARSLSGGRVQMLQVTWYAGLARVMTTDYIPFQKTHMVGYQTQKIVRTGNGLRDLEEEITIQEKLMGYVNYGD